MSWHIIIAFALYYSFFELIGNLVGSSFYSFFEYSYRPEGEAYTLVHLPVFTVIILSLLLTFHRILLRQRLLLSSVVLVVLILGTLLTFFRAYIIGVVFTIPIILLLTRHVRKSLMYFALAVPVLLTAIFIINISIDKNTFSKSLDSFVTSGIVELYEYKGGSLIGRDKITAGRVKLFRERPLLGWGFIDKDSKQGKIIRNTVGLSGAGEIGFVDKGYLDVLAKFGFIGAFLFYSAFIIILLRLIIMERKVSDPEFKSRILALAGLLLTFLIAQLTHANLTRQFGIIPFSMALGLVSREYYILLTSKYGMKRY